MYLLYYLRMEQSFSVIQQILIVFTNITTDIFIVLLVHTAMSQMVKYGTYYFVAQNNVTSSCLGMKARESA